MVQLPPFIFGLHDPGGEGLMLNAGKPGWVVISARASDPGGDYAALGDAGLGVIVRLNYGYGSEGTLPPSALYDQFAAQCAKYVSTSKGVNIWVVGNETNATAERARASESDDGEAITPDLYAQCFGKCRAKMLGVAGHGLDLIAPAAPSPWNYQTTYPENPNGDWIKYYHDILEHLVTIETPPTALALHAYTHGFDPTLVGSEDMVGPTYPDRHAHFRVYRDFLGIVPASLRSLPVLITEAQPSDPDWWQNQNVGWIQAAYSEIDTWNADPNNQAIQALCLFRWSVEDERWSVSDKPRVLDDLRAALRFNYRARTSIVPTPPSSQPETPATPVPSPTHPAPTPSTTGWCPFAIKREITTNNFDCGRSGHKVKAVVLHIAAGPMTAVFPTFNDPKRLASAHFCVGKNGAVEQYVSIDDVAYSVGLRYTDGQWYNTRRKPVKPTWQDIDPPHNPNLYTISVEHEGHPEDEWTPEMYASNDRLLKWISEQCQIWYDPHRTLIGHCEIDNVDRARCPGPHVDYAQIAADANGQAPNTAPPTTVPAELLAALTGGAAQMMNLKIETTAPLYQFGHAHDLGCPQTEEAEFGVDGETYVVQWFTNGFAYAKRGDWNNIHCTNQTDPNSPPPSDAVYAAAVAAIHEKPWLPIHTSFALYKYAHANGLGCPESDEYEFTLDVEYVAQLYTSGYVFVKKGDWGNCRWTKKPSA